MSYPVQAATLPPEALLQKYCGPDGHTDCFAVEFPGAVPHAEYVEAFYTTAVFKLERVILATLISKPSTDEDARELALGRRESFAAWSVEARAENQLLMCDFQGRTRSWLMVTPSVSPGITRLYFGSAVVPKVGRRTGQSAMGFPYRALLGFHKLYSRVLLGAAARRIGKNRSAQK